MQTGSSLYVAELLVPSALYASHGDRGAIPNPGGFGITRGYWRVHFQPDHLQTERPTGLMLTVQFVSEDRETAEDLAITVGLGLSEVISLYSGSPLTKLLLRRLARIGPADGILEQNEYIYHREMDNLPRIKVDTPEFTKILQWFGNLDAEEEYRSKLAARWYGMAVGASDPLDGYLAVWIGLESIGPAVDRRFHPSGPKVACQVCQNKAGEDRDRKTAGIDHAVRLVAPEILDSRSIDDLVNIRNQIAHGLAPANDLRSAAEELVPDLTLVLGVATLTAARPEEVKPGSGKAALPRDYETRPDARASLLSSVELVNHCPYYGGWIPFKREYVDEYSRTEPDGRYFWGALRAGIGWKPSVSSPSPDLTKEYVEFKRLGSDFTFPSVELPESQPPPVPIGPWRVRPVSKAWERYLGNVQN